LLDGIEFVKLLFGDEVGIDCLHDVHDEALVLSLNLVLNNRFSFFAHGLEVWKQLLGLHVGDEHEVDAIVVQTVVDVGRNVLVPFLQDLDELFESRVKSGVLQDHVGMKYFSCFVDHDVNFKIQVGVSEFKDPAWLDESWHLT
jgi:hypothetical protein